MAFVRSHAMRAPLVPPFAWSKSALGMATRTRAAQLPRPALRSLDRHLVNNARLQSGTSTGNDQTGHIEAGQNEGIFFLDRW